MIFIAGGEFKTGAWLVTAIRWFAGSFRMVRSDFGCYPLAPRYGVQVLRRIDDQGKR